MEEIAAKSIVIKTKDTSWFGIRYQMNLYRGCCHGCIYCDSRSDCYGIDRFDTVRVKKDALRIVRDELQHKVLRGVVGTGAMSDLYNPFEKDRRLTRHALELLDAYEFGTAIATKSSLITRDIDILQSIREHSPVLCKITVTTTDEVLCRQIEPYASSSIERFRAIEKLSKANIFCGILLMPVLPFLEDNSKNIVQIIHAASQSGAKFIYPAFGMTLRQNQREYYLKKIEELFPGQNLRQKYERRYGTRYWCVSPHAAKLWSVFEEECQKRGLLYKMRDISRAYQAGYGQQQLSFFDSHNSD